MHDSRVIRCGAAEYRVTDPAGTVWTVILVNGTWDTHHTETGLRWDTASGQPSEQVAFGLILNLRARP